MGEDVEFFSCGEFTDTEYDSDYEFDAARYFDFTRPEWIEESTVDESWFESAGSYGPSPFVIKLYLKEGVAVKNSSPSPKCKESKNVNPCGNESNGSMDHDGSMLNGNTTDDILKKRMKSSIRKFQSRTSTLMKPTASMLAKQNQQAEVHSTRCQTRFQKPLPKTSEGSSKNAPTVDNHEIKRQKLETGYLRKVAHLKHQPLFAHKASRKHGHLDHGRLRITIPKEPDLETAHRASRHLRANNNVEPGECTVSIVRRFKAQPLNRKILEAPSLATLKRGMPPQPEFQVFHLKTAERAMRCTSNNILEAPSLATPKRGMPQQPEFQVDSLCNGAHSQAQTVESARESPDDDLMDEKFEMAHNLKSCSFNKKDFNSASEKWSASDISTELLNKLSLAPKVQTNTNALPKPLMHAKGLKENLQGAFHQGYGDGVCQRKAATIWREDPMCS